MKRVILSNITEEFAFRVIDPAVPPEESLKPKLGSVAASGLVAGLLVGIILALVVHSVQGRRDAFGGGQ